MGIQSPSVNAYQGFGGRGLEPLSDEYSSVPVNEQKELQSPSVRLSLLQLVFVLCTAVVGTIFLRAVVIGIFVIPTSSMEPSLLAGDVVVVSKISYWLGVPPVIPFTDLVIPRPYRWQWHSPLRGDIVVFRFAYHRDYPSEPEYFVKRIVGVAGDTLWVFGDSVYYTKPPIRFRRSAQQQYTGLVVVPRRGMQVELTRRTVGYWRRFIEREGKTVASNRGMITIDGQPTSHYIFSQNYYFVIGDNRVHSFDSRYWGFVSESDIVGMPVIVLWSRSTILNKIRWDRIGVIPR